jgi:hypothetical protein
VAYTVARALRALEETASFLLLISLLTFAWQRSELQAEVVAEAKALQEKLKLGSLFNVIITSNDRREEEVSGMWLYGCPAKVHCS